MLVMNSAQKHQALACQALWERVVEGCADRLHIMAEGQDESIAAQINQHEQRIRGTPASKVASGDTNLFLIDQYDCTLAPVVQSGVAPWDRTPGIVKKLQSGPEGAAQVPQMFTAPWVVNVEVHGKALNVDMRVAYVFDKDAALEAFDKGDESPTLCTTTAGVAMSLSLRDFAVKFGSLLEAKVTQACIDTLPFAEFAAFPKMSNIEEGGQDAIKSDFPEGGTLYMNVAATLKKTGILVGEGFIKTNLCGGGSQFVPPKVKADVAKLDFPEKVTEMPDLEEFQYQEITYDAFDLDNWSELGDIEYRVLLPGSMMDVKDDQTLVSDPAKGEAFVKTKVPSATSGAIKKFLTEECLVYAVLA